MLTLKNIFMKYKGSNQEVLKDINLSFPNRGIVFIIGSSGSGKSTLLNLIAGFIKPTSGNIIYNDKEITKFKGKDLNNYILNDIAVIHQNYNLINYLNVDDNIKLKNKNYDKSLLNKLGIIHLKNKKVNGLSGGEKQRVAIARALANSSKIILADEPTGALDSKNSKKIIKILRDVSKTHLVIVVTHNRELIKKGDSVINIKDGRVKMNVQKYEVINNEISNKQKLKNKKEILSLVMMNIYNKFKRNLLTILAFSIGLITLLLVLSISKGFNIAIDESEKTTLSTYPITINENSYNIDDSFNDIFYTSKSKTNQIYVANDIHKNVIDEKFIKHLKSLESISKRIEYLHYIDESLITYTNDIDSFNNDIEFLSGKNIQRENELLLLLDKNNTITSEVANMLSLEKKVYDYNELLDLELLIENKKYYVVGIVKGKEDSFYLETSGLYSRYEFNNVPLSINIIPKDYESKTKIISSIRDYGGIEFTDYASSIKNISTTVVNAITIVLIIFSFISLIITSFMMGIITYISVIERIHDIGILKSVGYTNKDVKKIFYLENIFLSLTSSLFSILVVTLIRIPLNNLLCNLTGFENILLFDINNVLYIIILSIAISIIGSVIPINKTKRLDILSALNYEQ